ncbi:hypothetical protein L798_14291 [Zootermopsis nevadensis]|uniref:Uncharacterized protein n=1 Tax=Zootermopsis nevadensis TaxID=136037 RepID=A0A067QSL3_ZOONE|nr:hypothetical protein L798_14291 [Zootermopsis nevadensis]
MPLQDPRQVDVAEAGNSSLAVPTFLAQEVCSHLTMLPVRALELSILPEISESSDEMTNCKTRDP